MTERQIEMLEESFDKVKKADAVNVIRMMMLGPDKTTPEDTQVMMGSMYDMAQLGTLVYLSRKPLLSALRGTITNDDDTVLEFEAE